jgi:benzoate-CoA ligase
MNGAANLVGRLIERSGERNWLDRVALREPDRHWTYAELFDQVARVATVLGQLGVAPNDRVAIFMPDTLESAAAILGTIHAGGVAVPLSELATANDLRDYLVDSGAEVAIVHRDLRAIVDEIRREVSLREVLCVGGEGAGEAGGRDLSFFDLVAGARPAVAPAAAAADDPAMILYSAGAAEGDRRGVPHTHDTPLFAFESYCRGVLGLGDADRVFCVVRLSTAFGLGTGLLFPLAAGAEAMLLPEQPHSDIIFSVIDAYEPTFVFATPSIYGQLARDARAARIERPLRGIRCVSGAEGMPPPLIDRVRAALGAEVLVGYGLTEAFQFVLASRSGEVRAGSCGQPVPGFEARVVNKRGARVGVHEIGTLEIRGATVAPAYWNAEPPPVSPGGAGGGRWFRTRDRFLVDEDGYYFHCGRVDDLFKVGGKWVSPSEVERALLGHEAVWECAVVGADDEDGLVKPLAFVVVNIGHAPSEKLASELRDHVKSELAPYKYPRWIEFVDELPKGPAGKILRYKLRPPPPAKRRAETSR